MATSWRQFSAKTLVLFASQLEIRPYSHLICLTVNTYCCFVFINSYPSYHIPETMSRNQDRSTRSLLEQGTAFAVAKSACNIGWRSQFWISDADTHQSIYIHSCTIILFVILRVLSDSQKYALPIRYNWCTRIIHGTRLKNWRLGSNVDRALDFLILYVEHHFLYRRF